MEEALARLYAKFSGLSEDPYALRDYGSENKRFAGRMTALRAAADVHFVQVPSQREEGEFDSIISEATALSIKRHRIAHGHITMWAEFRMPMPRPTGAFELSATVLYRWGAPFYSMDNLRTDPVGVDSASIEVVQKEFEALHNRVFRLTNALFPAP